ncbi:hypothetical protein CAEBREN_30444 [Caenorhabditis brenneri]|uniref:Uncharacterized protein n=1 Tax=Caenorhabditis brenneri TaxID=135651 RepID=G0PI68_CAEBE|nr:hypothetical protein CAEBREN_30444 [Caenorhabditis brenneri]
MWQESRHERKRNVLGTFQGNMIKNLKIQYVVLDLRDFYISKGGKMSDDFEEIVRNKLDVMYCNVKIPSNKMCHIMDILLLTLFKMSADSTYFMPNTVELKKILNSFDDLRSHYGFQLRDDLKEKLAQVRKKSRRRWESEFFLEKQIHLYEKWFAVVLLVSTIWIYWMTWPPE